MPTPLEINMQVRTQGPGGSPVRFTARGAGLSARSDARTGRLTWSISSSKMLSPNSAPVSALHRVHIQVKGQKLKVSRSFDVRVFRPGERDEKPPKIAHACVLPPWIGTLYVVDLNDDDRLDLVYTVDYPNAQGYTKQFIKLATDTGFDTLLAGNKAQGVDLVGMESLTLYQDPLGRPLLHYYHGQSAGHLTMIQISGRRLKTVLSVSGIELNTHFCPLVDPAGRVQGVEVAQGKQVHLYRWQKGRYLLWSKTKGSRKRCADLNTLPVPKVWPPRSAKLP